MIHVVITQDRDSGYHIQLRSRVAATIPDMQSRKCRTESDATRDAERLFGRLAWSSAEQAGLHSQPYVRAVARIDTKPG
jgi:hypothetical protein